MGFALALLLGAAGAALEATAQSTPLRLLKNVPDGTVGLAYKGRPRATGGTPPYTWSLAGGTALPDGLRLKSSKGRIVGTPTTAGTFNFTLRVTDSTGQSKSRDYTVTIGNAIELMEPISVNDAGELGNSFSGGAAVSDDGRFVAFTSFADNLVPNDDNGSADVFLRDRACGLTVRVSVNSAGEEVGTQSFAPSLSSLVGNTLFVAYASDARNLVPDDTNKLRDIFVTAVDASGCALTILDTARVSVGFDVEDGSLIEANGQCGLPSISADGMSVAYQSFARSLAEGKSGGSSDIFLTELQFAGGLITPLRTRRISTSKAGLGVEIATNLPDTGADIFSKTTIGNSGLSMAIDEHKDRWVKIVAGTGQGLTRTIKANDATTLTVKPKWTTTPDDTSVFRIITPTQRADIFSANTIGHSALVMPANAHVGREVQIVSGEGRGQVRSITANDATTLTVSPDWDTTPDDTSLFRVTTLSDQLADLFGDDALGNTALAMFSLEHAGKVLEIVAGTGEGQARGILTNDGTDFTLSEDWTVTPDSTSVFRVVAEALGNSFRGRISPDAAVVAFHTGNSVYLSDPPTGRTLLQSVASDGKPSGDLSFVSGLSGDGNLVLFQSAARQLVPDDKNKATDLFLRDRSTQETTRVSLANDGSEAKKDTGATAALSGGGRLVAFESFAPNLVADDRNNARDVFLRDRLTDETRRVSLGLDSINPNGECFDPAISLDGTVVAFTSSASNLVLDDSNHEADVFVATTGISDPPMIILSRLAAPRRGVPYQANLLAAGGTRPLFWTLTEGALPPGLYLDPSTGALSGVPQAPGSYTFTVQVMDADRPVRSSRRALTLVVKP